MKKTFICSNCGYVGEPVVITKGTMLTEIGLYLFFFWLAFIPGIVYSIYRLTSRYRGCPKCQAKNMIPSDSPIGSKMVS